MRHQLRDLVGAGRLHHLITAGEQPVGRRAQPVDRLRHAQREPADEQDREQHAQDQDGADEPEQNDNLRGTLFLGLVLKPLVEGVGDHQGHDHEQHQRHARADQQANEQRFDARLPDGHGTRPQWGRFASLSEKFSSAARGLLTAVRRAAET